MLRVGTDVVDVSEVAGSLQRLGDRYARRVFSEDELAVWRLEGATARAATDLAERFAGKEAAIKVLAPGERGLDCALRRGPPPPTGRVLAVPVRHRRRPGP